MTYSHIHTEIAAVKLWKVEQIDFVYKLKQELSSFALHPQCPSAAFQTAAEAITVSDKSNMGIQGPFVMAVSYLLQVCEFELLVGKIYKLISKMCQ